MKKTTKLDETRLKISEFVEGKSTSNAIMNGVAAALSVPLVCEMTPNNFCGVKVPVEACMPSKHSQACFRVACRIYISSHAVPVVDG